MRNKIKSIWLVCVILIQKVLDNIHRLIFGLPTLKRSQITADLFLGSQYNLIGLRKLKKLGVTAIVNMRIHSIYTHARYKGFKYLHLPTVDNTPPKLGDLIYGADFLFGEIKKGGKVYIHCRQGLGRGPTMTIAYLLKIGMTFSDAFALVKRVRPFIDPRPEQIAKLKELEAYYSTLK
ncbi:dual specificity protein phosphatase [uncultured Mucilaginibacter sp.]|uniref:protein-tyrosine phosphatase family protein n=1 Tax=uncultured Mucilaginibacter sp. TaxID=797541 RepID=UPI0025F8E888|nr:dual specificity protein phosphatase [uncultured Mucilaginibacter sp.]